MPSSATPSVLVVDDDPAIQALIRAVLSRIAVEVDLADNGDQAITKLFERESFSAIVLDLMMPRINGF